jgi:hypothetical protein
MDFFNQILISGIIILLFFIYIKKIFKEGDKPDILLELEKWKGSKDNFIRFKKYQYNQTFLMVFGLTPFITFSFGILIGFNKEILKIIGVFPLITLLVCSLIVLSKYISLIGGANNLSISNMKRILEST